jgi:hypothetical protein
MKKFSLLFVFLFGVFTAMADEGMWLPHLLQMLNERDMRKKGMKLKAKDIYDVNKGSLKDAIVSLGGFCTAEVISKQGLILTNHHCGFDAVQNHSSLEKNYIRDGFWAYEKSQELPNPGLFVTFINRIENITKLVLNGTDGLTEKERNAMIDKNINQIKKEYKREAYQDVMIRPIFEGNEYLLFVTETFKDVRLVGAPPASIGNFGKDTDNWMWPRHTGDFSLFRIYAGPDNKPAEYSPNNVPYKPKRALSISLKGMKAGDFTMVLGFPGRTNEYLSAAAIKQIMEVSNPAKIKIRHEVLQLLGKEMRADESIKIKYAAKYANIENAYKKWQGEVLGLQRSKAVQKRQARETEFMKRVKLNPDWNAKYGNLLTELAKNYQQIEPLSLARDYQNETYGRIELFNGAAILSSLMKTLSNTSNNAEEAIAKTLGKLDDHFKEMDLEVDQQMFGTMLRLYFTDMPSNKCSPVALNWYSRNRVQLDKAITAFYQNSILSNPTTINTLLEKSPAEIILAIRADSAMIMFQDIQQTYQRQVGDSIAPIQTNINRLQRNYLEAQMAVFKEKTFYPDANSTLRVTYGNVKGYQPRDGVQYDYYTYLDGVMEKYKPGDYEFDVPKKLIKLYETKDYGAYGVKGKQPVCFIASNHTTGGNSGSPALDAQGRLVGLNFDRVWEGTMSDINYDPNICRNIMVDIRYVLFIIDKFAEAKNLIGELSIVR